MAAFIANQRNWRYYEHVVTSRTAARDLLWTFDGVRRLGDAQTRKATSAPISDCDYVEPGVLWWAFARKSARRRGASSRAVATATEPSADLNKTRSADHAVVLIDEIDKAELDMPNGLLVPLGSSEFVVTETNQVVKKERPRSTLDAHVSRHLIVITTNEERELPQAFLRRCVTAKLDQPSGETLVDIARQHLLTCDGEFTDADESLARALSESLATIRQEAQDQGLRPPSTAEYLDALRACRSLGIKVDDPDDGRWEELRDLTLVKPQQPQW